MVPPLYTLGASFVLSTVSNRTLGAVYKIMAVRDNTDVTIQYSTTVLHSATNLMAGESVTFEADVNLVAMVKASENVLVARFHESRDEATGSTDVGGPSMVFVQPLVLSMNEVVFPTYSGMYSF